MNHDRSSEIIIPAIMPFNEGDVEAQVAQVSGVVDYVQIDLMDGVFVPQASWPYEDEVFALSEMYALEGVIKKYPGLKFEVDLMVDHAPSLAPALVHVGVHRVIFHHKAINDPIEVIQFKEENPEIEVGIALHTDDDPEVLLSYQDALSMIQCMGIENVGYQGQDFSEKSLEIIAEAHRLLPHLPIQVDGGVSLETIEKLADAGAYRFVAGSAIFRNEKPQEAVLQLAEKI
jgi:ribulose-phosphate 3-epimerase